MAEPWSVLLSAAVGLVSGFAGALGKSVLDRRAKVDDGLLARRADLYAELWRMTGILPQYPRDETLTYQRLTDQSAQLRDWYFTRSGGIYLSRPSQRAYLRLQAVIHDLVVAAQARRMQPMTPEDYERARRFGSALRTSLTADLYSRNASRLF